MRFGAHVPVAQGYTEAVEYAVSIGCEAMQIFAKSPRQWRASPFDPERAGAFRAAVAANGFGPVFTHTAYLINLTTEEPVLRSRSVLALADELRRASLLGAAGVVAHTGTDGLGDDGAAAARLARSIVEAIEAAELEDSPRLLLENTSGRGTLFGSTFGQLGRTIRESGLGANTLGICVDTCHAFAFGYPLDTAEGWRQALDEIGSEVGFERLGLIHTNDSMFERGSRHDRHAWVGDGHIGYEGFSAMVCAPELREVPGVCEMPGERPEKDIVNLERLSSLRAKCL